MHSDGLSTQDFLTAGKMLSDAGIDAIEVGANGTSVQGVRAGRDEGDFENYAKALTRGGQCSRHSCRRSPKH